MNKNSAVLSAIQQFYPDYHPLVAIAHIAHKQDVDPRLEFDCHRVIAKYVEPELKSLEVKGTITDARRVSVSLFDDSDVVDVEIVQPKQLQVSNQSVDDIVNVY